MNLEAINNPSDIKKMTVSELNILAENIREFLIENLATTGGHLGANLGVVELSIALHYLYNSPVDRMIWDVGHQAYIHKILTGRINLFSELRKYRGMSGFQKRSESIHDVWEAGHSSTSLSAAIGMAIARDLQGDNYDVIPIIGDGALTGGMALEALNHLGGLKTRLTIILNDNGMSISKNVGGLHEAFEKKRLEYASGDIEEASIYGAVFEQFGFTYIGPVDGHNIEQLLNNLKQARATAGPVIVHVLTKKGRGYLPAEVATGDHWHGVGPYDLKTGLIKTSNEKSFSWSEVASQTLEELATKREDFAVITPAMVIGSKLESFQKSFPKRIFDVGIAEQHGATFAAGMASNGIKPFLAIYSTFLQRGYDQLVHDICRQNLNVAIGIDRAGFVGADGDTHHGVFDIAFLRHIPNMKIMMPKDGQELKDMIHTAIEYTDGPIAVRYPKGDVDIEAGGLQVLRQIPIGSWEVLIEGADLAILTFGPMLAYAALAIVTLVNEGYQIKLVNARFIKPMDENLLHDLMAARIPILTIEEAVLIGGFGSGVLEFMESNHYDGQIIRRIGIPDVFIDHGSVEQLRTEVCLTTENIIRKSLEILNSEGNKK